MKCSFDQHESAVRSYSRSFPAVFSTAEGSWLQDGQGNRWLDFLSGAGALNYGHNPACLTAPVVTYIQKKGVLHSLDMMTDAKGRFLEEFAETILKPRNLDYCVQFCGPTGTNAVEAAVKLARKVTGRANIAAFTSGFHGMTLGSLSLSANASKRAGAGIALNNVVRFPFDAYHGPDINTIELMRRQLADQGSGIDRPAAFIVETVQGEGGLNVASITWLRALRDLAHDFDILLIVDDIQAGCGRCGSFFSFEEAGIVPDLVCLSKALSGIGLPLAVLLIRPDLDLWKPGEHNGTFRGNNLAFISATAALQEFWRDDRFSQKVQMKSNRMAGQLAGLSAKVPGSIVKGRGMMQGIAFADSSMASRISMAAFERGLIVETSGARDDVLKLLPPLTVSGDEIDQALTILNAVIDDLLREKAAA